MTIQDDSLTFKDIQRKGKTCLSNLRRWVRLRKGRTVMLARVACSAKGGKGGKLQSSGPAFPLLRKLCNLHLAILVVGIWFFC